jgi:hypothetical protein
LCPLRRPALGCEPSRTNDDCQKDAGVPKTVSKHVQVFPHGRSRYTGLMRLLRWQTAMQFKGDYPAIISQKNQYREKQITNDTAR